MKKINYQIRGMSCAACVSHVEHAAKKVLSEGEECTVSLLTNSISIVYDDEKREEKTLEKELSTTISKAGYTLLTDDKNGKKRKGKERRISSRAAKIDPFRCLYLGGDVPCHGGNDRASDSKISPWRGKRSGNGGLPIGAYRARFGPELQIF